MSFTLYVAVVVTAMAVGYWAGRTDGIEEGNLAARAELYKANR
jgi:hypothetical protein